MNIEKLIKWLLIGFFTKEVFIPVAKDIGKKLRPWLMHFREELANKPIQYNQKMPAQKPSNLIIGDMGSGKTYTAHYLMEVLHAFEPHKKYFLVEVEGNRRKHLPWWLKTIPDINKAPDNSVILLDEAHLVFHARESLSASSRKLLSHIALTRQRDITEIFVSQRARAIDIDIVDLCTNILDSFWTLFGQAIGHKGKLTIGYFVYNILLKSGIFCSNIVNREFLMLNFSKNLLPGDVRREMIQHFLKYLADGGYGKRNSAATCARRLATLSTFFKFLYREVLVRNNHTAESSVRRIVSVIVF